MARRIVTRLTPNSTDSSRSGAGWEPRGMEPCAIRPVISSYTCFATGFATPVMLPQTLTIPRKPRLRPRPRGRGLRRLAPFPE
jgi:hypothetical protein